MALEYEGIIVEQLPGGPRLALFSAPAHEIDAWAGIPQRRRLDGGIETAGFQREERQKRVAEIAAFMGDERNVIQNPLLAAVQDDGLVECIEITDSSHCKVRIELPDFEQRTLAGLVDAAITELVGRDASLKGRTPPADVVTRVRETLSDLSPAQLVTAEDGELGEALEEDDSPLIEEVDASVALFDDDSQVTDFYDELMARKIALAELGAAADDLESIAGFSKDFLVSLVKPVVLVDGQHRLRGALQAILNVEDSPEGAELVADLIDKGMGPQEARNELARLHGRQLPVSLLLSGSPAEHVFQFVVVNQKATQMSSALLGTIVSTSLTQDEMEPIRERLRSAGIELEGSRAVSYMRRASESPFRGLVSTGVGGDKPGALPWSVLAQLIHIVRSLDGAEYFHPPKVDYAKLWRRDGFSKSGLVDLDLSAPERLALWSANDGPWRTMFVRLFTAVRDKFGNVDDSAAQNYWGSTKSNLFNMVSLRILTADFFAFIQNRVLDTWDDLDEALDAWIGDLSPEYFARDWRMGGTKKDQPAIKGAWSSTWSEYRLTRDRLPRVERYNPGGKGVAG